MNVSAYERAFSASHHSPGIRHLRSILGASSTITDFCVPVNIGFPPPEFIERLQGELLERLKYYPSEPQALREKFSSFLDVAPETVIAGNGSTELFYSLLSALGPGRRVLTCVPTFGRWTDAPRGSGHFAIGVTRREENGFGLDPDETVNLANLHGVDTVIISNPNNPTGHLTSKRDLLDLIARLQSEARRLEYVIVDESFLDFSPLRRETTLLRDVRGMSGVIVLKSLGKSFGLHGTRMGVLVAPPKTVARIEGFVPYWNVNGVAEAVIDLMPAFRDQFEKSLTETIEATRHMREVLAKVNSIEVFNETHANFIYMKLKGDADPVRLRDRLLIEHGLFVRSCGNKEASDARNFRVATRPAPEAKRLVDALEDASRRL